MIYLISGKERRKLKKELSLLKHHIKMFWFYEDVSRVYGTGISDEDCEKLLAEMGEEITNLEIELKEEV